MATKFVVDSGWQLTPLSVCTAPESLQSPKSILSFLLEVSWKPDWFFKCYWFKHECTLVSSTASVTLSSLLQSLLELLITIPTDCISRFSAPSPHCSWPPPNSVPTPADPQASPCFSCLHLPLLMLSTPPYKCQKLTLRTLR